MIKSSTELALFNNHLLLAATEYAEMDDTCLATEDQEIKELAELSHIKPADLSLTKIIQIVSDFSKYLINPVRRSYITFHNSLTTFFFATFQWLKDTSNSSLKDVASRLLDRTTDKRPNNFQLDTSPWEQMSLKTNFIIVYWAV